MKTATAISDSDVLIVVDAQNDFCLGGALAVPHGDDRQPPGRKISQRRFDTGLAPARTFVVRFVHPGKRPYETMEAPYGTQVLWPDHCVQNTRGASFHNGLQIPHACLVLRKGTDPRSI